MGFRVYLLWTSATGGPSFAWLLTRSVWRVQLGLALGVQVLIGLGVQKV